METVVVDHPLVAQHLTRLRDAGTERAEFRLAADELAGMIGYEATRHLDVDRFDIQTPVAPTTGCRIARSPLIVPVLRAGLGMLGPMIRLLPGSATAFIGVSRDEETLEPIPYMNSVPDDLEGLPVLALDPMLATGGSMVYACRLLAERNAGPITAVCLLAAPEGVARLATSGLAERLVTATIDERLDENAFIVPGLGDAGDRLFGTA